MPAKAIFTWDAAKQLALQECHEQLKDSCKGSLLQKELAKRFRISYPDCRLSDASLRNCLYHLRRKISLPAEKPSSESIWRKEMDDYLVDCVAQAVANNALNLRLGVYEGRVGLHGGFLKIATSLFNERFSDFSENQVGLHERSIQSPIDGEFTNIDSQVSSRVSRLRGERVIPQPENSATPIVWDRALDIMKYWELGHSYSQDSLFEACCHKCSVLMWKTRTGSKKLKTVRLSKKVVIPIEVHYRQDFLDGVHYRKSEGVYYICEKCFKNQHGPSALDIFPMTQPGDFLVPEPEVCAGTLHFPSLSYIRKRLTIFLTSALSVWMDGRKATSVCVVFFPA
jgi:hypothetical protein